MRFSNSYLWVSVEIVNSLVGVGKLERDGTSPRENVGRSFTLQTDASVPVVQVNLYVDTVSSNAISTTAAYWPDFRHYQY